VKSGVGEMVLIDSRCEWCDGPLSPRGKRFCGYACSRAASKKRIPTVCQGCGKPMEIKPFQVRLGVGKFCSYTCRVYTRPEDFWPRVNREGPVPPHRPELGPCWLWTGATTPGGYGRFTLNKVYKSTHRVSYELTHGLIPDGLDVLHRCDVRMCVNPAHLFLGTDLDNMADMVAKGRQTLGTRNAMAKLNAEKVRDIKKRCGAKEISQSAIAREYGVDQCTVVDILQGRTWKHV